MRIADGIENALTFIEENLDDELTVEAIASRAYISAFHFQRIFSALCGCGVGEYIRSRRLSLAAEELSANRARVIDVALKYGYSSPDGFSRAFLRFHGVSPSDARAGAPVKCYPPLNLSEKLNKAGGHSMIDYKIVHKEAFTVVGFKRRFNTKDAYSEIPKWWDEYMSGENRPIMGAFGVCIDSEVDLFNYMIADNYQPWDEIPEGCEAVSFDAGDWAVFPCKMSTLQDTNTKMWGEWLPACKDYRLRANCDIEMYAPPEMDYCELWLPVEKI